MALPKTLVRLLRPYLIILTSSMIYLAIVQLENAESSAYRQSQSNIRTANSLIKANIEATFGKIYLLESTLQNLNPTTQGSLSFAELSQQILKQTPNFADILVFTRKTNEYTSTHGYPIKASYSNELHWHPLNSVNRNFYISSVYKNFGGRWVFAIKHSQPSFQKEIWVEFDLLHTTQSLKDLKTLEKGYVFVVDRETERLIFHPDPSRIGHQSISYNAGISHLISQGDNSGQYEYYYRDNFKVSVYDANNSLNWVFVSGTDRKDILATSYQFTLTAIVLASILLLIIISNYLIYQLNSQLADLNSTRDLASFKHQLKSVFDKFVFHQGVQFVLFEKATSQFCTLDYHGNKSVVFNDSKFAQSLAPSSLSYQGRSQNDPLAHALKITHRHYRIPLFDNDQLIAIIYLKASLPTYNSILRMIRDYTEVALSNLLLHHQLRNKDVMTQLDNKLSLTVDIENQVGNKGVYLALLELDNFEHLNTICGSDIGDKMILQTSESMRHCFPKPEGICLARTGGKQFGILFKAKDNDDATQRLESLKQNLASHMISKNGQTVSVQTNIGFSALCQTPEESLKQVEQALNQAKLLEPNCIESLHSRLRHTA